MHARLAAPGFLPLFLMGALACGEEPTRTAGAPPGPALVPLDSIRLEEADTLYIGNPYTPAIDPYDGTIYVPDLFSQRVHRFARDGSLIRTYGQPGEGPGEFRSAGSTFVLDDSTLAINDNMLRRMSLFDRRTGEFRRLLPMHGVMGISPPVVRDDGVWFALVDQNFRDPMYEVARSIAWWQPGRDTILHLGTMPAEFTTSATSGFWSYANQNLRGALAIHRGDIVRGWQLKNELVVFSPDGVVRDTLSIPVVRRVGVRENARELLDVKRISLEERVEGFSYLRQLYTLPDGSVAFTHHDQRALKLEPTPVLTTRVWVGLLSPDLKRACVDTELPVSQDARSMETFRGDTLFQLDRRLVGERLETWIRLFRVDPTGCEWLPVG